MLIDFEDREPTPTRWRTKAAFAALLVIGLWGMFGGYVM